MCIAVAAQEPAYQSLPTVELKSADAPLKADKPIKLLAPPLVNSKQSNGAAGSDAEKGEAANKQRTVLVRVLTSMLYVSLWFILSAAVIIYNKWILVVYDFPFPITLTMWHMGFSSVLATICVKAGWVPANKNMTSEVYQRAVLPIAVLFAGSLFLGNFVYMYLSIAFIQMLKALGTVCVFGIGCVFSVEEFSLSSLANMVLVTIGVAVASYGEIRFVLLGVILQLAAVALESTRLILVQVLLQKRGLSLNPILTLYYIAPPSFCFLSILWVFLEKDAVLAHPIGLSAIPIFLSNGAIAFGLNLSMFLLIGHTSALSMNIAGVAKNWSLIGVSVYMFGAQTSPTSVAGYSLAIAGACWYNYLKLKAMKAKSAPEIRNHSGDPEAAAPIAQQLTACEAKAGYSLSDAACNHSEKFAPCSPRLRPTHACGT